MAKRLIDTTIWTQNKWFRKLAPEYKLFWIYLFCNCDSVGIWEEDFELASFIIGHEYNREKVTEIFAEKIKWINKKKLWIVDFCDFQYGELKEENVTNRPHQSYIALLKKHRLWIDYTMTIQSHKEKEQEQDKEKKEEEKNGINYDLLIENYHTLCPKMNKVEVISSMRKKHINARIGEYGLEKVISVLRMAGESNFLNGKNDKAWKADFDWIMRPESFVKIMEGKYKNVYINPEEIKIVQTTIPSNQR